MCSICQQYLIPYGAAQKFQCLKKCVTLTFHLYIWSQPSVLVSLDRLKGDNQL